MRARENVITGTIAAVGLCCCTTFNAFHKFYVPIPGPSLGVPWIEPPTGSPKVYAYSSDPKADIVRAVEAGYVPIGISEFYSPPITMMKEALYAQAKSVGAALILIRPQYEDSTFAVAPWNVSNPAPVAIAPRLNDTMATFWVRLNLAELRLGVQFDTLSPTLRAELHRNTGVAVIVVIHGTPAFYAHIRRGDVIVKIGGENVTDTRTFRSQLVKFQGHTVTIELLRDDAPTRVTVSLHSSSE